MSGVVGLAPPLLSAVIPCLNEEENIGAIAAAVTGELEALGHSYEVIFIDNGSTDRTVELVKAICQVNDRVRLIVNTRNFGQMRSPTYGIYQATATGAVIGISADFQDPPEMVRQFVSAWRGGSMIVLGVRASEKTSFTLKAARALGYGFFEHFGDYRVIPGATGFGLYDRRVVDTLKTWRDPEPFFRGMLVETGYSLTTIPYHRPNRAGGVSKNNLFTLFGFALAGVVSSSKRLLRLPIYLGMFFFLMFAISIPLIAYDLLKARNATMAVVVGAVGFNIGLVLFFIGLVGEQVRVISEVVRCAPLVIERERVNFPSRDPVAGVERSPTS